MRTPDPDLDEAMEAMLAADEKAEAEARSALGIQRRLNAVSPGPWRLQTEQDDAEYASNPPYPYALIGPVNQSMLGRTDSVARDYQTSVTEIVDLSMADAEFLARAREDIPRLLACFDALLVLVSLKEMKERGTDLDLYAAAKPGAWDDAKRAVTALLPPMTQTDDTGQAMVDKVVAMIPAMRAALRADAAAEGTL